MIRQSSLRLLMPTLLFLLYPWASSQAASTSHSTSVDIANRNSTYFSLPQYDGANGPLTGVTFTAKLTYPTAVSLYVYSSEVIPPQTFSESYTVTPWILWPGDDWRLDAITATVAFTSSPHDGTHFPNAFVDAAATPAIADGNWIYGFDPNNPNTSFTGNGTIQFVADQIFPTNAPAPFIRVGASAEIFTGTITYSYASPVPAPPSIAMLAAGLLGLFAASRRRATRA